MPICELGWGGAAVTRRGVALLTPAATARSTKRPPLCCQVQSAASVCTASIADCSVAPCSPVHYRPVQRRDNALGDGVGQPERGTDREHRLADDGFLSNCREGLRGQPGR
jgi:hypothetical protein